MSRKSFITLIAVVAGVLIIATTRFVYTTQIHAGKSAVVTPTATQQQPNPPPADPCDGLNGKPHDTSAVAPATANTPSGMIWIPGGTFTMGSPACVGDSNEHPQHTVTISGFYMDSTEVTQAEFTRIMGSNPSHFKGCPCCPVDSVSWEDAHEYCKRVNKRLPTEAEWEYAVRAGSSSKYFWGDSMNDDYAWHYGNSGNQTHPVAQKKPNAFGLYDMVGNVWEWCADWYAGDYYAKSAANDPAGPDSGEFHLNRGGGFGYNLDGYILRTAYRNCYPLNYRNINVGFRCAR